MASETDGGSGRRRLVAGGDWSVGLNAPTSLSHAKLLLHLGERLRPVYDDVFREPVPDRLAALVRQLDHPGPR